MIYLPMRRILASAAVLVGIGLATAAAAATVDVHTCGLAVAPGKATLTRDLDCSGSPAWSIVLERGTLYLDGHTLVTGTNYGIFCTGNCKIVGPGTITGDGSGISSSKSLRVTDVTISLSGGIGAAAGDGALTLQGVTVTGPVVGAIAATGAKIIDSTITATAMGVLSGSGSMADGPCQKGSVLLRRSSVTGSTTTYCGDTDPEANCADIVSCKRPKVSQSTCTTSCQAGTGVPCPTWGVCSGD